MQSSPLSSLILQYLDGTLPAAGQAELRSMMANEALANEIKATLEELLQQTQPGTEAYNEADWAAMAQNIVAVDKPSLQQPARPKAALHRVHFLKKSWFRYAAAVLLLAAAGWAVRTFYQQKQKADIVRRIEKSQHNDARPGGNKALLTLADGTSIVLDSASNGQLTSRGNVRIVKLHDGQLQFIVGRPVSPNDTTANQFSTITTPRGGQYQIDLPDGTHIWLNAATSVRFPLAFAGSKRQVQLDGEAYFEVAKDAAHPFEVAANNTTIAVLGTHFNVNAYPDEKEVTTTLLEGKVQVAASTGNAALLPGYQCRTGNGSTRTNPHADTEEAVAWKNGQFQFSGADVETIMRQISRWYGVKATFLAGIPSVHITGEMPRALTLRQVMEVLRESGIRVWLEADNQLYVAPGP